MNEFEEYRKEVLDLMRGMILAEREACARVAPKAVANKIRARPEPKLPPLALGLKNVSQTRRREK